MSDLISREAAIEAIQTAYCTPCKERGDDYNEVRCRACAFDDAMNVIDAIDDAIDANSPQWAILRTKIGFLPSAEAKWIPCSERLPDAEDCPMDCIVTRKNEFIGNFVDMAVAESEAPATEPEADKDSRGNMSLKPPGDSISRSDAKDKAKEIMYSILDDTDYNDIESMAHACLMMKIKILKMFDEFPSAEAVQRGW